MKFKPLSIPGTFEVFIEPNEDSRGSFENLYKENDPEIRLFEIKQVNVSRNLHKATLRGLHYQTTPSLESKIVSCLAGELFDVMVDLRPGSKCYGEWQYIVLKPSFNSVLIPEGVAHGFQTLKDGCIVHYLHSKEYSPSLASGVKFDDPDLKIEWPLEVSVISENDLNLPSFSMLTSAL
jgi:dTDP-4-dehydrorhamnose 3,5-epimerase